MDERLKSHATSPQSVQEVVAKTSARIKKDGDKEHVSVARQLELLQELTEFSFGQFLLVNQGIDGYWTHYILTHPWYGRKTGKNDRDQPPSEMESFLLDRAPTILATQQRFEIFLAEIQPSVVNAAVLASIPCGMMGELLYLDYKKIDDIKLVGIDYDANALQYATVLAEKKNLAHFTELVEQDAWALGFSGEFDLISSNGLNIYETDDAVVTALYKNFYNALKPQGKLVTSFLTHPPGASEHCEWDMDNIDQDDLLLQRIIFADIINAKWQCFRSTQQTQAQLSAAGFTRVRFVYDQAHMFPTVIAEK